MKVLLKKDVDSLGYAGEIFNVSAGFGRNFLIPKGFAVQATDGTLKQATAWMDQAAARREQLRQEYAALFERLNGSAITFDARSGDSGRLYGSVTTEQIVAKIAEELGVEIERKKVSVPGKALRTLGAHNATVRLDGEFQAIVRVNVVDEEARAAEKAAAAEDEVAEDEVTEDEVAESVDDIIDAEASVD
ncbi:MAG: large subunit ribosomal protein L9 [Cellvibrionaceae bacterium]|jgi:large subunit ribosomal protein L9